MSGEDTFDVGRFARLVTLITFVTAVFLITASARLSNQLFSIAAVAVGTIAVVTAITGFLIASASYIGD